MTSTVHPIGVRISALMERKNFTQERMALYLGVPTATLVNWIKGRRQPGPSVARLLDVLGTIEVLAPAVHNSLMPPVRKAHTRVSVE